MLLNVRPYRLEQNSGQYLIYDQMFGFGGYVITKCRRGGQNIFTIIVMEKIAIGNKKQPSVARRLLAPS